MRDSLVLRNWVSKSTAPPRRPGTESDDFRSPHRISWKLLNPAFVSDLDPLILDTYDASERHAGDVSFIESELAATNDAGKTASIRLWRSEPTGGFSKSRAQRIRLDGNAANVGLGAYPVVTLARARQKALANARIVSEGRDPRAPFVRCSASGLCCSNTVRDRYALRESEGAWRSAEMLTAWRTTGAWIGCLD